MRGTGDTVGVGTSTVNPSTSAVGSPGGVGTVAVVDPGFVADERRSR